MRIYDEGLSGVFSRKMEGSGMEKAKVTEKQHSGEMEVLRRRLMALEEECEEQKKALRRSAALYRSMLGAIPDIIYKLDADGNILFINEAVRNYGYTPEELLGVNFMTLIHPEDREKAVYRVNERRSGDRSTRSLEVRLLTKKHASVPFEINSVGGEVHPTLLISAKGIYTSEMPRSETFWMTQGVARDISERRGAEEALREIDRVRVLHETAGAAAHEINQPLTGILGMLDLLMMKDDLDAGLKGDLEMIYAQAERISEILDKMVNTQRYATKPYVLGEEIIDFDLAS